MLHIHHANRLELLQQELLRQLHEHASADPFAAEQVIVPHAAMRRHLSLAIADAHGVCANLQFGFLAQWLWRQIAQHVPGVADDSPFAAATLVWRVHGAFADAGFVAAHPRLRAYLRDADALAHYELACEVAALFEQYLTYRADWLQAWAQGPAAAALAPPAASPDTAWQAALWRRIVGQIELPVSHPAQAFAAALRRGAAELPPRLHVFALPQIAPQHLQLLHEIGRRVEVRLYVWNPCREYWFDLIDRRRLSHLAARGRDAVHAEEGNRLLAAWGKQTQQHIEALVEVCGDDAEDHAHFAASGGASLLAQVHDALLELRAIEPGSLRLAEGDRIVAVDGERVADWDAMAKAIQSHAARDPRLVLLLDRNGSEQELALTAKRDGENADGTPRFILGVKPRDIRDALLKYGPIDAFPAAVAQTWKMTATTFKLLGHLVFGRASLQNVSGPIGIARSANLSVQLGFASFLFFLGLLSLSIGLLNLLPIPILDGGHILYYLIELIKGSPVSDRTLVAGQYVGLAMLSGLIGLAFFNDISGLFR